MKLVLATNQTEKFVQFYQDMQGRSGGNMDYSSYRHLLFAFDTDSDQPIRVLDVKSGKSLTDYDGVYINGYLNAYELAATVATCCDFLKIPFVNSEMRDAPSLSKLTAYAKLAAAHVSIPRTFAGTKDVIISAEPLIDEAIFPAILKRADADRGIDNFKVQNFGEVKQLLDEHDDTSLWVLQQFIENDGFYLVSYYNREPKFSIFRSLEKRPDGNEFKAHMYKPKGGGNASLIELADLPTGLLETSTKAINTLKREIGSVDSLYDATSGKTYVLEVNYNPQLVTIETFKDVRVQAFLDSIALQW